MKIICVFMGFLIFILGFSELPEPRNKVLLRIYERIDSFVEWFFHSIFPIAICLVGVLMIVGGIFGDGIVEVS